MQAWRQQQQGSKKLKYDLNIWQINPETCAKYYPVFAIDKKFLQKNHVTRNNSVCLSAALLINQFDTKVADHMINMLDSKEQINIQTDIL